jgi:hypothetical protein
MRRLLPIALLASIAFAQGADPFAPKAPPEVDAALRARVKEFFDLHIKSQYRKAESLVAEDTKDYFYAGNKPRYDSCEIKVIQYFEQFTHAKVSTTCEQWIPISGLTNGPMSITNSGTWKLEEGKWVWYVDENVRYATPFGQMKPGASSGPSSPSPVPASPPVISADFLLGQVKLSTAKLELKEGVPGEVTISNGAPGPMTILILQAVPQIEAKIESPRIPAKGTTTLTLRALKGAQSGTLVLATELSGQQLPLEITITK